MATTMVTANAGKIMSQYQFNGWKFSDFTDGSLPHCPGKSCDCQVENCGPTTLDADAQGFTITVVDNADQNAEQVTADGNSIFLASAITLNGTTFPAGSRIQASYVLKTDGFSSNTLIIGNLLQPTDNDEQSGVRLVFTSSTLTPGQTIGFSNRGYAAENGQGQNCFARGTLIDTPHGAIAIEHLEDGDEVLAPDGSIQLISWVGGRRLTGLELVLNPHLQPVRIMAGALTGGRPGQDLFLSQSHRLLVDDWRAPYLFGEDEILVPANSLLNGTNVITECPMAGVEYYHLLMDGHSMVCANGLWAETMLPGQENLQMLHPEQRREVLGLQAGMEGEYRSILPALPHQSAPSIAA